MRENISPSQFGLSKRIIIQKDEESFIIVKQRKSRIIMKDVMQILEIANTIRQKEYQANIKLLISGPVCSKSIKFLKENNIELIS
jgi:nicotinate-nucleotide pyrophosphorylase